MKRLIKRLLKAVWQKTAFLRRPIVRQVDRHLCNLFQHVFQANITNLGLANPSHYHDAAHNTLTYEVNLVLNSVVREIARLQLEVETLQQMVEELPTHRSGLSLVGETVEHNLFTDRAGEHAQVG
jgi:hypothetical protein